MERKDRCVGLTYKNGRLYAKICYGFTDYMECEEFEYEVLDKQVLEEKLAELVSESSMNQVISCISENCREFWEL